MVLMRHPGCFPPGSRLFRGIRSGSDVTSSCWKAYCRCVLQFMKMRVHVYGKRVYVFLSALCGQPCYFCLEGRWKACATPQHSCLPSFPVLCPGATRVHSALLCYPLAVPMVQHHYPLLADADSARARGKGRYARGKPETDGAG